MYSNSCHKAYIQKSTLIFTETAALQKTAYCFLPLTIKDEFFFTK
jgi:hypothetical protein